MMLIGESSEFNFYFLILAVKEGANGGTQFSVNYYFFGQKWDMENVPISHIHHHDRHWCPYRVLYSGGSFIFTPGLQNSP